MTKHLICKQGSWSVPSLKLSVIKSELSPSTSPTFPLTVWIYHIDFRSLEFKHAHLFGELNSKNHWLGTCIKKYHFGCISSRLNCWLSIVDNGNSGGDGSTLTKYSSLLPKYATWTWEECAYLAGRCALRPTNPPFGYWTPSSFKSWEHRHKRKKQHSRCWKSHRRNFRVPG